MTNRQFLDSMVFRLKVDGAVRSILYKFIADHDEGGKGSIAWILPDGRLEIKAIVTEHSAEGVRVASSYFGNRVEAFLLFDNMIGAPSQEIPRHS